mmetsp:Transcript_33017/g.65421  ORF Transcript_33017/g.65421 Transcript_33017/m.65421 type:complete len:93 (+) Transcript_33017:482-760(+)
MQHALAEAAGVDDTFFDIISAGIEEEKDYKEIFIAVERHYEKRKKANTENKNQHSATAAVAQYDEGVYKRKHIGYCELSDSEDFGDDSSDRQ